MLIWELERPCLFSFQICKSMIPPEWLQSEVVKVVCETIWMRPLLFMINRCLNWPVLQSFFLMHKHPEQGFGTTPPSVSCLHNVSPVSSFKNWSWNLIPSAGGSYTRLYGERDFRTHPATGQVAFFASRKTLPGRWLSSASRPPTSPSSSAATRPCCQTLQILLPLNTPVHAWVCWGSWKRAFGKWKVKKKSCWWQQISACLVLNFRLTCQVSGVLWWIGKRMVHRHLEWFHRYPSVPCRLDKNLTGLTPSEKECGMSPIHSIRILGRLS